MAENTITRHNNSTNVSLENNAGAGVSTSAPVHSGQAPTLPTISAENGSKEVTDLSNFVQSPTLHKKLKQLPVDVLQQIFGGPDTAKKPTILLNTIGISLKDLSPEAKLDIARNLTYGVLETAEKLNLSPRAVVSTIPHQRTRLFKIAEILGKAKNKEELAERLDMFTHMRLNPETYEMTREIDPMLGFSGPGLKAANEMVKSPLPLLHLPAFSILKEDHAAAGGTESSTAGSPDETQDAAVQNEHASKLQAAHAEVEKAFEELNKFLSEATHPEACEAIMVGLREQLGGKGEVADAARMVYQSNFGGAQLTSEKKAYLIAHELAMLPPGVNHTEYIQNVLMKTPDWTNPAISPDFGLDAAHHDMVNALLSTPLFYLEGLENKPQQMVDSKQKPVPQNPESQKKALDRIKSSIDGMKGDTQKLAKGVMLMGLSSRIKFLKTDELKLDAVKFINDHFYEPQTDRRRHQTPKPIVLDGHKSLMINNMLAVTKGLAHVESNKLRRELLSNLSNTIDQANEGFVYFGAMPRREHLIKELSESFADQKKTKREAIKLMGKAIRQITPDEAPDPNNPGWRMRVEQKPHFSQETQLAVLSKLLGVAGNIHSVETQRQILVEFSHSMNSDVLLDAEAKKELAILLAQTIPSLHFSKLDSGSNMQHKAYKLLRAIVQESTYEKISLPSDPRSQNAIFNDNHTRFSDRQLGEIIAAAANTLPEQSTSMRPGRRVLMNDDIIDPKQWPKLKERLGRDRPFYALGRLGGAVVGAPIDLALATKPYIAPRPPIRTSLAKNLLSSLSDLHRNGDEQTVYDRLDSMNERLPGWTSLLSNSKSLKRNPQHEVVEGFLRTVELRDKKITQAHKHVHTEIGNTIANSFGPLDSVDQDAEAEIANLRKSLRPPLEVNGEPAPLDEHMKTKDFYRVRGGQHIDGEGNIIELPEQRSTPEDLARRPDKSRVVNLHDWVDQRHREGKPLLLSYENTYRFLGPQLTPARSTELVGQVMAKRDERVRSAVDNIEEQALDALVATHVQLDDPRNDENARINGMTLAEFRQEARPAIAKIVGMERKSRERQKVTNELIDRDIALLQTAKDKKKKINLVGRTDLKLKIRKLEKTRSEEIKRIKDETAAEVAAIEMPHLQRYKTAFTGAFSVLAEILPDMPDGFTEGVVPALQKKTLGERARESLTQHNTYLHAENRIAVPPVGPRVPATALIPESASDAGVSVDTNPVHQEAVSTEANRIPGAA